MSRFILLRLIYLDTLSLFPIYNTFFTTYHVILQYSTADMFLVLYGEFSRLTFDPLTQNALNSYMTRIYVQYGAMQFTIIDMQLL